MVDMNLLLKDSFKNVPNRSDLLKTIIDNTEAIPIFQEGSKKSGGNRSGSKKFQGNKFKRNHNSMARRYKGKSPKDKKSIKSMPRNSYDIIG